MYAIKDALGVHYIDVGPSLELNLIRQCSTNVVSYLFPPTVYYGSTIAIYHHFAFKYCTVQDMVSRGVLGLCAGYNLTI